MGDRQVRFRTGVGFLACGALAILATGYKVAQGQRQGASAPIMMRAFGWNDPRH
jgi:hypothetical protein